MINTLFDHTRNSTDHILEGDFNYADTDWDREVCSRDAEHHASKCLERVMDSSVFQSVRGPIHFRVLEQANVLDLIFPHNECDASNLVYLPPIGKSHHVVLSFE